jgi:hypothetical protein
VYVVHNGYRLINAAVCYDLLKSKFPNGVQLSKNKSQLRPLVENLKPSQWFQAWKQVVAETLGIGLTAEAVEKVVRRLGGKSCRPKHTDRGKARQKVPNTNVAKIVKVAEEALGRPKATTGYLRKVLEKIRDQLNRLRNVISP